MKPLAFIGAASIVLALAAVVAGSRAARRLAIERGLTFDV